MTELIARLIGGLARLQRPMFNWAKRMMKENNMAGPKEQAALDALDAAIDAAQEWKNDEDENDAAALNARVAKIRSLVPSNPSHLPIDQNGQPVDGTGSDVGPTAPDTSAPSSDPGSGGPSDRPDDSQF